MCAMKLMKLILPTAALLVFVGCDDARVTNLERRVNQLEENVRKIESEQSKKGDNESANREQLEACIKDANDAYDQGLILNGTKNPKGYLVPVPLMDQLAKQKSQRIEECKLLYSK